MLLVGGEGLSINVSELTLIDRVLPPSDLSAPLPLGKLSNECLGDWMLVD